MEDWKRKGIVYWGKIQNFAAVFFYKSKKNEVFSLKGLRKGSYLNLNDVIRYRIPDYAGADPEPLIEYWISPEDYEAIFDQGKRGLKIQYRCKINYIAKNKIEQPTAFVAGTATIQDGLLRTRKPRLLLVPLYYMARIVSGFHHP